MARALRGPLPSSTIAAMTICDETRRDATISPADSFSAGRPCSGSRRAMTQRKGYGSTGSDPDLVLCTLGPATRMPGPLGLGRHKSLRRQSANWEIRL
jgi:hypothetical protein